MPTLMEFAADHLARRQALKAKLEASSEPLVLPTDDEHRLMQHQMYVASGSMGSKHNVLMENQDVQ